MRHYWRDSFWRNNAIFLFGSLLVAFLNYLYYPILGRLMDVSNFGEVQALLSLFNLVGMLLVAFQIVIVNISANDRRASARITQQFEYMALLFMLAICLMIIIFAQSLQQFFNLQSPIPFVALGLSLVLSVPMAFRNSFIEGRKMFLAASVGGGIAAIGKLLFSTILIIAGLQTFGAIVGIVIAQILSLIYISYIARKVGFTSSIGRIILLSDIAQLKPELRYLLSVMIVFFSVTFLYTGDILIVKRFFEPEIAGQYAGISAIAKIIFFATVSFSAVLLASVGPSFSPEHNRRTLLKSFLLTITVGGLALLVFALFPKLIVSLMLGEQYISVFYLLPLLSVVMLLVSIINLCFYYFLALRQYVIVPIAAAGGVTALVMTTIRHDTLELVIQNFLFGSIAVLLSLIGLGVYYGTIKKHG